MHEVALLAAGEGMATGSLVDILAGAAAADPKRTALLHRRSGRREAVSLRALLDEVRALAAGIAAAGVQPGDRVGLMATPDATWLVAGLASWYAGAVVVPLSPTSPADRAEWALTDSGAVGLFLGDGQARQTFEAIAHLVPNVREVWGMREDPLDRLAALGTVVGEDDLEQRRATADADSPASIWYVPNGTGDLLGAVLSHGAVGAAAETTAQAVLDLPLPAPAGPAVLALPATDILHQVFALGLLRAGVPLGFATPDADVLDVLHDWEPTILATDPLTLENTMQAAGERERDAGRPRVLGAAAAAARLALLDRGSQRRLPALLGGRLAAVLCGGAVLGAARRRQLRAAGLAVRQAVGGPQSCGLLALGEPSPEGAIGTAPGTELRIHGAEILVRGPQVFDGYHNDRRATAAAIDEGGWLHTGQRGFCDGEGNVRVTGRVDDILVTSGGAAVAVAPLEDQLRASPLIDECLVVGTDLPHLTALVTLDPTGIHAWLQSQQRSPSSDDVLADDPDLHAALRTILDELNASLAPGEQIADCHVLPQAVAEPGLTPTQQTPRSAIETRLVPAILGRDG